MSFKGPTPPNTMTDSDQGYGYAECSRCGFRTPISDQMTPEENPDLYSRSADQVLLHNCDPEPYNWPVSARERTKQKLSILTAIGEIRRWNGVLDRCLPFFSPETNDTATQIVRDESESFEIAADRLLDLIGNEPGPMV